MNTVLEDTARKYMWQRIADTLQIPVAGPDCTARKRARQAFAKSVGYDKPFLLQPEGEDYQKAEQAPLASTLSKKARRDYPLNYDCPTPCTAGYAVNCINNCISTSCTAPGYPTEICKGGMKAKEEKETTMACVMTENLETSQRNYLNSRLVTVRVDKHEEIGGKYTPGVESPNTKDEISRKLLAGEFELPGKYFDGDGKLVVYRNWNDVLRWTDPSKTQDKAGRDAAYVVQEKAYTAAKDAITVGSLADGLKALQEFEAMTF